MNVGPSNVFHCPSYGPAKISGARKININYFVLIFKVSCFRNVTFFYKFSNRIFKKGKVLPVWAVKAHWKIRNVN
jgi:hypothetical protein